MEKILLAAGAEDSGRRLDAFIAESADGVTRNAAQRLIETGNVTVGGKPAQKSCRLKGGEKIEITLPEPEQTDIAAQDIPLDVVYEDADVIVVNKPSGMVVHPAPGHSDGTLVNALLAHCGDSLSGIGGERRPGIVHRIDRDTSGLIIAAKNDRAHVALAAQLKDHSLARTYEAIVVGNMNEDSGTVDAPIGRCPTDRKKMCVTDKNSREAVTHWEVLERFRGFCHVRCRLETGRTHQIRVHMAHIGHPILGDTVYGAKKPVSGLTGQCLHAVGLKFTHPTTGEEVCLSCPLPPEFTRRLEKLRALSGEGLYFRRAEMDDLDAVCAFFRRAIEKMRAEGVDLWDELYPTREIFVDDIERGEMYLGVVGARPVAALVLNDECDDVCGSALPEESFIMLHRLCVDPDFQGRGTAQTAVEFAEDHARNEGYACLRLDVFSENPKARRLYARLGYTRVGELYRRKGKFYMMEKTL